MSYKMTLDDRFIVQALGGTARKSRDAYKALVRPEGPKRAWQCIDKVLQELGSGAVDEHGGWEVGFHADKKWRNAINVDIYGIAVVKRQALAVVQVRQYVKKKSWTFANVRKNYFLVGRNEGTRRPFAHPIPSAVVHGAIRRSPDDPEIAVIATLAWIWDVREHELGLIVRHGDVALVPVKRIPQCDQRDELGAVSDMPLPSATDHLLSAQAVTRASVDGETVLIASGPSLKHGKGQHKTVSAEGVFRVQVGRRASFWKFASPTQD